MILDIKLGKEISVLAQNRVGMLSEVAKVLADRGINIMAVSAQGAGGVGLMNLVTDDPTRTVDLLRKKKYSIQENSVLLVWVEDRPGILRRLTRKLAVKRIDILNIYGSSVAGYDKCLLVIATSNNQRAMVALKAK